MCSFCRPTEQTLKDMTRMASSPKAGSIPWRDRPLLTIEQTSVLLGGSKSRTYGLLVSGELEAIKLVGKTLIKTPSVVALLERQDEPWKPDLKRIEKAVAGRPDVARKRAKAAASNTRVINSDRAQAKESQARFRTGDAV
jgi:hypothetical protein